MMAAVARLFLVRHAETEWNTATVFQGHHDSALTPRGLQQAAELAERLAREGVVAVYSSDQGRALRTAAVVGSRLGLEVVPSRGLREIDCGDWTGHSYQEARLRWPEQYAVWKHNPHLHRMPNGETVAEVQLRALRFVEDAHLRHEGRAFCAVTHNTVVRALLCHLRGRPLSSFWEGKRQHNCAINLIEFEGGETRLLEIGNTSHLSSYGAAGTSSVV